MLSVRKLITTVILLLAVARLSAQSYDTYALSRFKAAEFYRTGLNFNVSGGLNGTGNDGKSTINSKQGSSKYEQNSESDGSYNDQRFNTEMLHTLDWRQGQYDYSGYFQSSISFNANHQDKNSSDRLPGSESFVKENSDDNSNATRYYQGYDIRYASQFYIDQLFARFTPNARYNKEDSDQDSQKNRSSKDIYHPYDSTSIVRETLYDNSQNGTGWEEEYSFDLPLSFGYGKIENVTDARQAIYILDELQNSGYLTERLSDESIDRLATEINRIKNQRVLDSREKAKYQLAALDSVLFASGKLKERNIGYFNIINDNWNYGANQSREHGWTAGVTASYAKDSEIRCTSSENNQAEHRTVTQLFNQDTVYFYNNHTKKSTTIQTRYSSDIDNYALGCFGRLQQQIDLYSQYGISLSLNHRWSKYEKDEDYYSFQKELEQDSLQINKSNDETLTQNNFKTISAELSINYDYFPTTRTTISNTITAAYGNQKEDRTTTIKPGEQTDNFTYESISFVWNSNISYYFSPQLSASLYGSLRYNHSENDYDYSNNYNDYSSNDRSDSDSFSYNLSVGMSYTLY